MKTIKKKILLSVLLLAATSSLTAQTANVIVSELENTFLTYNVNPYYASRWKIKDVKISYDAPIITIKISNFDNDEHIDFLFKFDILRTHFLSGASIRMGTNIGKFGEQIQILYNNN
jgi:hypothetical protein